MCRHARLLTVCLACLLFSAHTYGLEEEKSQIDGSCDMNQLFEAHSSNGSLSKQGLDKILKTISVICRQTKANETLTPHQHLPKPNESINYKGKQFNLIEFLAITKDFVVFSLALRLSERSVHLWMRFRRRGRHQNPAQMARTAGHSISSLVGRRYLNGRCRSSSHPTR